ncbi:hypothetical protein [Streptomyces sp. NPDC002521]
MLLVVHNVTSATRLLDVLPLFHGDMRVQLLASCTGSSPFQDGVTELLSQVGVPVLPWDQALSTPVDLAVSASFGGQLADISGKLVVLPHGSGYFKRLWTTGASAFGLSPEWLLTEDSRPFVDAMVLSHPEQLERLRTACPQALQAAVVAGDPAFDRIMAAQPRRERFRRAFGVRRGQRLIVFSSTWNPESIFGDGGSGDVAPSLLARLTGELPADEFRVTAVLHPNTWHGHGPGQIRIWLNQARQRGLTLVDPLRDWRQAVIAADALIGDFGAVSYYAAALGVPVLLGADPGEVLVPESPVAAFVRETPRLEPAKPLRPQLDALITEHRPLSAPAAFVTSVPGQSAVLLRRLFYRLIGIPEPVGPALLPSLPLPAYAQVERTDRVWAVTRPLGEEGVVVIRYAELEPAQTEGGELHIAVHEDTWDPQALAQAEVILQYGAADDPRFIPLQEWGDEVLADHPGCVIAAYITSPDTCFARTRSGETVWLTGHPRAAEPAAYASALYGWLSAGRTLKELYADGMAVRTGAVTHQVSVRPAD